MDKIKLFPVILINVGILMILNNLNSLDRIFGNYWPTILITIGIVLIANSFLEKE